MIINGLLVVIVLAPVLIILIPLYHVTFKTPKNRFTIPLYLTGAIFSFFLGVNLAIMDGQNYLEENVFDLRWTNSEEQELEIYRLYYKKGKPVDIQKGIQTRFEKYINSAKKEFYEFLLE
ncbi:MAG: hypothetical protein OXC03_09820 [Flavobacteriaceae bacterium]|nr:hypothetical protein [Flavobacteriaceae bacterium]